MKRLIITAATVVAFGGAFAPVLADDRPTSKGPPVTMGNEGKLPATGTVSGKVPEMGATGADGASSGEGSASPKGPPVTMGNEGKLPATGTMSRTVPKMNTPPPAKE